MTIHHNSHDPVFVKKISLRLWKLRDEIEYVLKEKGEQDLVGLRNEYTTSVITTQISEEVEDESELSAEESTEDAVNDSDELEVKQRRPKISDEKIIRGMAILSEIRMDTLFLFCNQMLMPGQSVVVDFVVPKRFVINAEVVFCRPYNMKSRIISSNKLPYRAAVKFTYLKEGERTLLRQFLESIEPDTELVAQAAEAKASAAKDDDLGDLDDLDL